MLQPRRDPPTAKNRRYFDEEDKPRRLKAQFLSVLTILAGAGYLVWLTFALNRAYPYMAAMFMAAEVACLGLFVLSTLGIWRLRFKPPQGLPTDRPYSVDIFMTTAGEPFRVASKTMRAISRIHWEGPLRVYILDDAAQPEIEALAGELGFTYLSRRKEGLERINAKSGNLNFGLSRSQGELILTLDVDQVPRPEIVTALAGYMRFPKVAFVQSKQSFVTPEGDVFYNRSEVFYDVVQLGLDSTDTVISCGSGVLYRRSALESIGGWITWNLVEDLTTAYELHAHGWQSFYVPHAYSRGLAPEDIWGVYQQRGQWALDTMRIFWWDNPLFKKGLRWKNRLGYLTVACSYFSAALFFPFFYIIPLWTYVTGHTILIRHEFEFLFIRAIYLLFMTMAIHYLCHKHQPGKQFKMLSGLFPIYMRGIVLSLFYPKGRKPGYQVNNPGGTRLSGEPQTVAASPAPVAQPAVRPAESTGPVRNKRKRPPRIVAVLPQLALLVGNIALPFYALYAGTCHPRLLAANIFVSTLAVWAMSQVIIAAFSPVRYSPTDNPELLYAPDSPEAGI